MKVLPINLLLILQDPLNCQLKLFDYLNKYITRPLISLFMHLFYRQSK